MEKMILNEKVSQFQLEASRISFRRKPSPNHFTICTLLFIQHHERCLTTAKSLRFIFSVSLQEFSANRKRCLIPPQFCNWIKAMLVETMKILTGLRVVLFLSQKVHTDLIKRWGLGHSAFTATIVRFPSAIHSFVLNQFLIPSLSSTSFLLSPPYLSSSQIPLCLI